MKDGEGKVVGRVTSGTFSPCLKYGVGMAYIDNKLAKVIIMIIKIGNVCNVNVRGRDINIKVTKMPFVESKYFR